MTELEREQRVQQIARTAAELALPERRSYIAEACAGDPELARDVWSRIEETAKQTTRITVEPVIKGMPDSPALRQPGGRYEIIRELGHGGMGTVFLARRREGKLAYQVALKIVRPRLVADREAMRRFDTERSILASLDHPNIARLLDVGSTAEGTPFLVMEHIEGKRIDVYCEDRGLGTQERLRLFRTVCLAVHAAHQSLVVHRDLKPSNILVTADGTVKLLDFGIAKLLAPDTGGALTETMTGHQPYTLRYASPEQISGGRVTTGCDIYSLGVVLYELFTGRSPYPETGLTPIQLAKIVCEEEPCKPSSAILQAQTSARPARDLDSPVLTHRPPCPHRHLRGDLDAIVLKTLRRDPGDRYASAEQLAEDIRRHLDGEPVKARKGSFAYRALKFTTRHRAAMAVAGVFMALTLAFAVSLQLQLERTAVERDKAEQVAAFLVDLFKVADPIAAKGELLTVREVLDRGAERVDRELAGQPAVQVTLMDSIAKVYLNLGMYEQARELYEQVVELRRRPGAATRLELAHALGNLGSALRDEGQIDAAEQRFREALAVHRELGEAGVELATAMHNLANCVALLGRFDEAERLFRESLRMREELLGERNLPVAESLCGLGMLLGEAGRYDEAEQAFRRCIELRRELGDDEVRLGIDLTNLASVLTNIGRLDEAEQLYREVLQLRQTILGEDHPKVASILANLGVLMEKKGEREESAKLLRRALSLRERTLGPDHLVTVITASNLGYLLRKSGDVEGALPLARRAYEVYLEKLGPDHPGTARAARVVALVEADRGELTEAERLFRQALTTARNAFGEENPFTTALSSDLGGVLIERGRVEEARTLLEAALAIQRASAPEGNRSVAVTLGRLGKLALANSDAEAAQGQLDEALSIARETTEPDDPGRAQIEVWLGECLLRQGRNREAEPLLTAGHRALANHYKTPVPKVRAAARLLKQLR